MPSEKPYAPVTNEAVEDLAHCITEAADQIAVLRDSIDDLRVDFSWAVQNKRLSRGACPVLKRMAADPTAADWRERLEIVRESNESNPHPVDPHHVLPIVDQLLAGAEEVISCLMEVRDSLSGQFSATKRPSPDEIVTTRESSEKVTGQQTWADEPEAEPSSIEVICPGDPVDFVHDGHGCFGEVLRIDDAAGTADVCIVPTMESVTVDLSMLKRTRDDDDDHSFTDLSVDAGPTVETEPSTDQPYTLNDYRIFRERLALGMVSAQRLKSECARFAASRNAFVTTLTKHHKAPELRAMAAGLGCDDGRRARKRTIAQNIFNKKLAIFALGREITWHPRAGETYVQAVRRIVDTITDQDIALYLEKRAEDTTDPVPADVETVPSDTAGEPESQPISAETPGTRTPVPKPPRGKLFSEPGDQQRLF